MKAEAWEQYLEADVLFARSPQGLQVYEVTIKLTHANLLAVIKAHGEAGYMVAFVGRKTLRTLAAGIRDRIQGDPGKWREDKFRKT